VSPIDGPSGGEIHAGKALARPWLRLVDTGAVPALALKALRAGVGLGDGEGLASRCGTRIELVDGGLGVLLDREDATAAIRHAR
jgi:hypothetical protein